MDGQTIRERFALRVRVAETDARLGDKGTRVDGVWSCRPIIEEAVAALDQERAELTSATATIERQGEILTSVVNALRGDPPEGTQWSHHDAASLASSERRRREVAVEAAERHRGELRVLQIAQTQATACAGCGKRKHTPLRVDGMGGYVCLTCIDVRLHALLEEERTADTSLPAVASFHG